MSDAALFDRIGVGGLLAVIADFYDRLFADVMIGYLFARADRARLVEKELELTAKFLGGPIPYTGRSMREAHAAHRIVGGQFDRRLQILRNTLRDHAVDAEVQRVWIEHQHQLRHAVVAGDCE